MLCELIEKTFPGREVNLIGHSMVRRLFLTRAHDTIADYPMPTLRVASIAAFSFLTSNRPLSKFAP